MLQYMWVCQARALERSDMPSIMSRGRERSWDNQFLGIKHEYMCVAGYQMYVDQIPDDFGGGRCMLQVVDDVQPLKMGDARDTRMLIMGSGM